MSFKKVGLISPGDMGHRVAMILKSQGLEVLCSLDGRSPRTRELARIAGVRTVDSQEQLVREVDLILSILVPSEAEGAAASVCQALRTAGADTLYVDCNAIAPSSAHRIARLVKQVGSRFVDGGIIGPPPIRQGTTRFYISGPDAAEVERLSAYGLDVRVLGSEVGQASGFKMTYAGLSKGFAALAIGILVAARRLDLYEPLIEELRLSQPERLARMEKSLPQVPPKAHRWVGEMEEIAQTFKELGLTPSIHQGAAEMYRFLGKSPLADETPETLDSERTLEQVIEILGSLGKSV